MYIYEYKKVWKDIRTCIYLVLIVGKVCSKFSMEISHLILKITLGDRYYYYCHPFLQIRRDPKQLVNLPIEGFNLSNLTSEYILLTSIL